MNLDHARDWFCEQHRISNKIEITHAKNHWGLLDWARTWNYPSTFLKVSCYDYGEAFFVHSTDKDPRSHIVITHKATNLPSTIFHELVHWRQECREEIQLMECEGWIDRYWKGIWVHPGTPYMELPWEKEAFGEMYELANQYAQHVASQQPAMEVA